MSSLVNFFQEGVESCPEPPNKPGFPEFSGAQTPTGAPTRKRSRGGRARRGEVMPGHGRNHALGLQNVRTPQAVQVSGVVFRTCPFTFNTHSCPVDYPAGAPCAAEGASPPGSVFHCPEDLGGGRPHFPGISPPPRK
ncbi:hypothetical protein KOW79_006761 [Hemibagrus wyckioides]|uniref:Uncharacterized protein n=1 Tax=Hemibagrus wyckioides TaxID=337641 RepID=A0A9D3NYM1_9TELE|nr:hypothetical protein KOW79_006761 [Hemibagrus wyckioides]